MTERERHQLVIHLGEGKVGARIKAQCEMTAKRMGLTLSTWARQVLHEAADVVTAESFVSNVRFEALEKRVRAVEEKKPLQTVMVDGQLVTRSPDCSGCLFPHGLCGPCSRWNGRGSF